MSSPGLPAVKPAHFFRAGCSGVGGLDARLVGLSRRVHSIERRPATVQDVGRALHPGYVEGQMQGGVAQKIGGALNEEYIKDGRVDNPGLPRLSCRAARICRCWTR